MRASRRGGRSTAALTTIGLLLGALTLLAASPSGADGNEAPDSPLRYQAISAGVGFTCAILDDDTVKCWGDDTVGQLGDGGTDTNLGAPPATAVNLGTGRTATAISAGDTHTCAILDTGKVKCWGADDRGQLGDGGTNTDLGAPPATPINLGNRRTATAIAAGGLHSCAILDTGRVKCWGADDRGQLGDGGTDTDLGAPPATPISLGAGRTATAIAAGYLTTCAVLDDGSVKCWGGDELGALGDGGTDADLGAPPADPISLGAGRTATALSMGELHACALLDDGSVKCWGADGFGQLGDGGTNTPLNTPPTDPVALGAGRTATAVTAGGFHTCAVLDDATLKCWGGDTDGQLGDGGTNADLGAPPADPVDLGTDRTASAVTAGSLHTCVALDNARLKCWGSDQAGGLGDGGADAGLAAPPTDPVALGANRRVAGVPGPPCGGEPSTVVLEFGDLPTSGRDVIYGTTGPDTINALGGDDIVCGRGGDDTVDGGNGQDIIYGGGGEDVLRAGSGGGILGGNDGDDVLVGGDGNDTLRGGNDDDTITGRGGNDLANGGPGTDTCSLTPGVDTATDCEA